MGPRRSRFGWLSGTQYYMLSAAHCGPDGGTYTTSYPATVGSAAATTQENWDPGSGTSIFPGDSIYRGDFTFIPIRSPSYAIAAMYNGDGNSTSWAIVSGRWTGAPSPGDQFCTGGAYSFEICGFAVDGSMIRVNIYVQFEGWLMNVTQGGKSGGACVTNGDSGGPVYTVRSGDGH